MYWAIVKHKDTGITGVYGYISRDLFEKCNKGIEVIREVNDPVQAVLDCESEKGLDSKVE